MKIISGTIIFITLLFTCFSCGSGIDKSEESKRGPEAAADYFDMVLKPVTPLIHSYHKVYRQTSADMFSFSPSRILKGVEKYEAGLKKLQELSTSTADKIAALEGFNGDKTLRNAVLDYSEYLEGFAYDQAPEYIRLLRDYANRYKEIEKEEVDALNKFIDKMNKESDSQGNKFEKAQSAFAKKYNFRLLPGKLLFESGVSTFVRSLPEQGGI